MKLSIASFTTADTVDTFPPFSTLEEDSSESANGYKIQDDGADSPRVIGKATGDSQTASEGFASGEAYSK